MVTSLVIFAAYLVAAGLLHYAAKLFITELLWPQIDSASNESYRDIQSLNINDDKDSNFNKFIQSSDITLIAPDQLRQSKSAATYEQWTISSDALTYTLSNCNSIGATNEEQLPPDITPIINLKLPGQVHTDLIAAGVITTDPYYRYEERELAWITEKCWQYESEQFLLVGTDEWSPLYLRFEAVDSVASYYFNDVLIGTSDNAFHPQTMQVPAAVQQKLWKTSATAVGVRLRIVLHSARKIAKERAFQYPYSVPATENYNVWAEPTSRNFVRKAGADFGWDWGPAFIPSGIMGSVQFYQTAVGKLEGFTVQQTLSEDLQFAALDVKVHLSSLLPLEYQSKSVTTAAVSLRLYLDGALQHELILQPDEVVPIVDFPCVEVKQPKLWWPRGFGEQQLYTIKVTFAEDQMLQKHVGIRRVELIQSPLAATATTASFDTSASKSSSKQSAAARVSAAATEVLVDVTATSVAAAAKATTSLYTVPPATFYLKVNGVPIFMRGANYIPSDAFRSRVTTADKQYVLLAAAESNMNTVRVWGGGAYEEEAFYALADSLGIMIWQEIMLACSLYPRNKQFLSEITAEVQHQSLLLGSHPSIVIWGGNNENEVALGWFSQSQQNRDLYIADYAKLYADTVFPALESVMGQFMTRQQAAWVDSSPSNGLLSREDPYVKLWGQASTSTAGDMHFYNYNCDCEDPAAFPAARFVSEFGFQSMPSFLSYAAVTAPQDWRPDSQLLLYRQRHQNGNEEIDAQIVRHFALPAAATTDDDSNSGSGDKRYFDMYLYLSGLQQSRCYETAITRWRQMRGVPDQQQQQRQQPQQQHEQQQYDNDVNSISPSSKLSDGSSSSSNSYMMGILYWQLNDIWQGPSWSSMEWSGRWKPLQYAVKRAFAPLVVTMSPVTTTTTTAADSDLFTFDVCAVNDNLDDHAIEVKVELLSTEVTAAVTAATADASSSQQEEGAVLWQQPVNAPGNSSVLLQQISISKQTLQQAHCTKQTCFIKVSTAISSLEDNSAFSVPSNTLLMDQVKNVRFRKDPAIFVSNFRQLSNRMVSFDVQVNATSPFLFFELQTTPAETADKAATTVATGGVYNTAAAGWFSDNNFLAEAGRVYGLTYTFHSQQQQQQALDLRKFRDSLKARVLQHAYDRDLPLTPTYLQL